MRAGRLLLLLPLVGACDEPVPAGFDAPGYEIVTTSPLLRNGGASFFSDAAYWAPGYQNYVPTFCDLGFSSVAIGADATSVTIDWQGCNQSFTSAYGTLIYVGDGIYEGVLDVTTTSLPDAFGVLFRFEPRVYE